MVVLKKTNGFIDTLKYLKTANKPKKIMVKCKRNKNNLFVDNLKWYKL